MACLQLKCTGQLQFELICGGRVWEDSMSMFIEPGFILQKLSHFKIVSRKNIHV
jgi:hypothetical protein